MERLREEVPRVAFRQRIVGEHRDTDS
jgi:hypothetical protein